MRAAVVAIASTAAKTDHMIWPANRCSSPMRARKLPRSVATPTSPRSVDFVMGLLLAGALVFGPNTFVLTTHPQRAPSRTAASVQGVWACQARTSVPRPKNKTLSQRRLSRRLQYDCIRASSRRYDCIRVSSRRRYTSEARCRCDAGHTGSVN